MPLDFHDIYLYTNRLREPVDSPTKQKHSHEVGTTAVWPSSPSVTSFQMIIESSKCISNNANNDDHNNNYYMMIIYHLH